MKIIITSKLGFGLFVLTCISGLTVHGAPVDPGWPRIFKNEKVQLTVYQPQVDFWKDYSQLHYRCAISVKGVAAEERFGVAEVDAATVVDQALRAVAITPVKRDFRFAGSSDAELVSLRSAIELVNPLGRTTMLSLDRLLAYVDPAQQQEQRTVAVNLAPPKIFHSSAAAILVMFMGDPEFRPVSKERGDLLFAVNTNWDIFYDSMGQRYYLLNEGTWLTAVDPKGPWIACNELPKALQELPHEDNWADVRKAIPAKGANEAPVVFVSYEPAELIVTRGDPSFSPITGTKIMRITNSDNSLFIESSDGMYYILVAGRWFRAKGLDGPWSSASMDLPSDFAKIPDGNPASYVKAAVPGTRDAQDAVLVASIPNSTAVRKNEAKLEVIYTGEPQYESIPGTVVKYAINASEPTFLVDGAYYSCSQGIWFTSANANGPWGLCAEVPKPIYSIPVSHPTHNVTYVTVQSSTPETVIYSQTSGYSGEYVAANGVLMFGAGMMLGALLTDHHGYHYYANPLLYSYGCGAIYHHGFGGYYRAGHHHYGPYGGAGRIASYNPVNGTYRRGAYAYGPAGSASIRQAFNPYTGGYAQVAQVNTVHGSAGRFEVQGSKGSVSGAYRSGAQGSIGGLKTGSGAGAVAWDTKNSQGAVIKGKQGNVYAGKDGNVYRRDSDGNWQTNSGNGWSSASADKRAGSSAVAPKASGRMPETGAKRPNAGSAAGTRQMPSIAPSTRQGLDRDVQARSIGNRPSASFPSSSSTRSVGFSGRGGSSIRSSGGGRRR